MSCCYLCSSNIFAMINYVGFATWVSLFTSNPEKRITYLLVQTALNWTGCLLPALPSMEAPGVGKTNQGRFWFVKIDVYTSLVFFRSISSSQSSTSSAPSSLPLSPWLHLLWRQVRTHVTHYSFLEAFFLRLFDIFYFQALAVLSSSPESLSTSLLSPMTMLRNLSLSGGS